MGRDCSMCSSKRGKSVPVSRRGALRLLNIRSNIVGHYRDRRYKDSARRFWEDGGCAHQGV